MKFNELMALLATHTDKAIIFEYALGKTVPIPYHVTEVKNVQVESVDCGGNPHAYKEVWIQLWVDEKEKEGTALSGKKVKGIVDKVNEKLPLFQDQEVFFEYGDKDVKTSVYTVDSIVEEQERVVVKLFSAPTQCKPRSGGGSCC